MNRHDYDEIALFRYQVIAPLLSIEPGKGKLREAISKFASRSYEFAGEPKVSKVGIKKSPRKARSRRLEQRRAKWT